MLRRLTKWHHSLLLSLIGVFLFIPTIVFAEEAIRSFNVDIEVLPDSSLYIVETIEYDFGGLNRHGIFRDIPYKYETNVGNRKVVIDVESVTRNGLDEPFKVSRTGDNVHIRIGDPNSYVKGRKVYRIIYTVEGALRSLDNFDELYWDAIGHGWDISIDTVRVQISGVPNIEKTTCFYGSYASRAECELVPNSIGTLTVRHGTLLSGEGITIAVAYQKGIISFPTLPLQMWRWLTANPLIFIPIFVFLFMYGLWYRRGRDAKGRGTIIPEYTPPSALNPLFLGSVVDGRLHRRDITAGILYLAQQNLLDLVKIEKKKLIGTEIDHKLIWRGDYENLSQINKLVTKLLFGGSVTKDEEVTLTELKKDTNLSIRRKELQKHIDTELQRAGYFANKPHSTREKWLGISLTSLVILHAFWSFSFVLGIATAISVVIIAVFGQLMPKRTRAGAEMREHILGFKQFLEVTERERLDFHNAPERTSKEFMEFLPFAIALKVEKKWAKQFEKIHINQPSWYKGGNMSTFTSSAFISNISDFNTSVGSSVTTTSGGSGISGGGFSGGGSGGGGGGSW